MSISLASLYIQQDFLSAINITLFLFFRSKTFDSPVSNYNLWPRTERDIIFFFAFFSRNAALELAGNLAGN